MTRVRASPGPSRVLPRGMGGRFPAPSGRLLRGAGGGVTRGQYHGVARVMPGRSTVRFQGAGIRMPASANGAVPTIGRGMQNTYRGQPQGVGFRGQPRGPLQNVTIRAIGPSAHRGQLQNGGNVVRRGPSRDPMQRQVVVSQGGSRGIVQGVDRVPPDIGTSINRGLHSTTSRTVQRDDAVWQGEVPASLQHGGGLRHEDATSGQPNPCRSLHQNIVPQEERRDGSRQEGGRSSSSSESITIQVPVSYSSSYQPWGWQINDIYFGSVSYRTFYKSFRIRILPINGIYSGSESYRTFQIILDPNPTLQSSVSESDQRRQNSPQKQPTGSGSTTLLVRSCVRQ